MNNTVYIDFQASIQHQSGDRIIVQLQDMGSMGKNLSARAIRNTGQEVPVSKEQAEKAFRELRKALVDFLPA